MLEMNHITKVFPGVRALDDVSFSVKKGAIHGLVGENGAGKSTLIKVLSGAYTCDCGEVIIDGEEISNANPAKMISKGVAVIYQELMLLNHRTVAENVYLGRFPRTKLGMINYKKMRMDTLKILESLDLDLDPDAYISDLSVAKRQMVEISKAMSRNAKVIVLDEPTAVLCESELQGLFNLVRSLSKKGITFIYISHRIKEVFELCTDLTIMKDGRVVESGKVSEYNTEKVVTRMVGRDISDIYPSRVGRKFGEEVLKVENLRCDGVKGVSFSLRKGEILGLAGLAGAGRTETLRAIIGADPIHAGNIYVHGTKVTFRSPRSAISAHLGIVPEERKTQGLLLKQTVTYNTSIAAIQRFTKAGLINLAKERENTHRYIDMFHTRPNNPSMCVQNMSGGNQQKVVLSKWLTTNCQILLVDEPTRGIDVGAKQEIYQILNDLVNEGMSILMVSSELPELLGVCDRIIVMSEGHMTALLDYNEATEEILMSYATC